MLVRERLREFIGMYLVTEPESHRPARLKVYQYWRARGNQKNTLLGLVTIPHERQEESREKRRVTRVTQQRIASIQFDGSCGVKFLPRLVVREVECDRIKNGSPLADRNNHGLPLVEAMQRVFGGLDQTVLRDSRRHPFFRLASTTRPVNMHAGPCRSAFIRHLEQHPTFTVSDSPHAVSVEQFGHFVLRDEIHRSTPTHHSIGYG